VREGLSSDEREERRRLRRQVKALEEEREILKKPLGFVGLRDQARRAARRSLSAGTCRVRAGERIYFLAGLTPSTRDAI